MLLTIEQSVPPIVAAILLTSARIVRFSRLAARVPYADQLTSRLAIEHARYLSYCVTCPRQMLQLCARKELHARNANTFKNSTKFP
jgi:hypothetical protein